jgi:hypothetical protein
MRQADRRRDRETKRERKRVDNKTRPGSPTSTVLEFSLTIVENSNKN